MFRAVAEGARLLLARPLCKKCSKVLERDWPFLTATGTERDRDHALGEEWRHDPGHRRNVPYRDAAVSAVFGRGTPAASLNPAFRGRLTAPSRVQGPLQTRCRKSGNVLGWRAPNCRLTAVGLGARRSGPLLKGPGVTRRRPARVGGAQPALEGVDPTPGRPLASARGRLTVGPQSPSALGRSAPVSEMSSRR